ncbi:hypothetical protein ACLKA7_002684 [Drosophila subpalustris]
MTPTSLSMSTPTLSSLHHQRMSQSQLQLTLQSQSQSQSPSPLTPHSASPSSFFGVSSSPKFPANYERSEKGLLVSMTHSQTRQAVPQLVLASITCIPTVQSG